MRRAALLVGLAMLGAGAPAEATILPAGFSERMLVGGLEGPTSVAFTPDGRLLVAEKAGRLLVVNPGSLVAKPVLDLRKETADDFDRGMLGLDVDRSFAKNGYVYIAHVYLADPANEEGRQTARLIRLKLGRDNRVLARKVILGRQGGEPCAEPYNERDCLPVDTSSHSVGEVKAAADGTVWMTLGDSSSSLGSDGRFVYSPLRAQRDDFFGGKLIHVDRNGRGLRGHPFCPGDDDLTRTCTKIWAKGFRNPFRFHLTRMGPVVADVGWYEYEELNRIVKGGNYGWPCFEGPNPQTVAEIRQTDECRAVAADPALRPPDLAYKNDGVASIISGPRYSGSTFPKMYRGVQFFADYARGEIRMAGPGATDWASSVAFAGDWLGVDLEQNPRGNLVYVNIGFRGSSNDPGSIWEIVHTGGNRLPRPAFRMSRRFGRSPLAVTLDAHPSRDPDRHRLTYVWVFEDGSRATGRRVRQVFRGRRRQSVTLIADDGRDQASASKDVWPGNRAKPAIAWTTKPQSYRTGVPVRLAVRARDGRRPLRGRRIAWHVLLKHNTHFHEVLRATGRGASFRPARDHGAGSSFIVFVTATDSQGLPVTRRAVIPFARRAG